MKKSWKRIALLLLVFISLCTMLTGCQLFSNDKDSVDQIPEIVDDGSPLSAMKIQLTKDFSYTISYMYSDFPYVGFSQTIEQHSAKDGSFAFTCETKQWNNTTEYESTDLAEYYYRYENDEFICYLRHNYGEVTRSEVSDKVQREMEADRKRTLGYESLLPSYLMDFTEEAPGEKYTFRLPMARILEDNSYLAVYLNNIFTARDFTYDSSMELEIIGTCIVEKGSYKPLEITYDFSELKPYVLSNGANSAEYALDMECMYLEYHFDYDIPETAEAPDGLLDG